MTRNVIQIRLSPEERQKWEEAAKAEGNTLSTWIRSCCNEAIAFEPQTSQPIETIAEAAQETRSPAKPTQPSKWVCKCGRKNFTPTCPCGARQP